MHVCACMCACACACVCVCMFVCAPAAYWLSSWLVPSAFLYNPETPARGSTAHHGLALPPSLITKDSVPQTCPQPSLMETFFSAEVSSSLTCVKVTKKDGHLENCLDEEKDRQINEKTDGRRKKGTCGWMGRLVVKWKTDGHRDR